MAAAKAHVGPPGLAGTGCSRRSGGPDHCRCHGCHHRPVCQPTAAHLVSSASSFLAADRQLEAENGRPIPDSWLQEATDQGLATGRMVEFSTMVLGADNFQLVSVKAVSNEYPLRGDIEIQREPTGPRELVNQGPGPGEVWINPRLLRLLDLEIGSLWKSGIWT